MACVQVVGEAARAPEGSRLFKQAKQGCFAYDWGATSLGTARARLGHGTGLPPHAIAWLTKPSQRQAIAPGGITPFGGSRELRHDRHLDIGVYTPICWAVQQAGLSKLLIKKFHN